MMSVRRMLVVEDNAADQDLLTALIAEHAPDLVVLRAADGDEAIAVIDDWNRTPGCCAAVLVLLDWNLPCSPGADVLERIRAGSVTRQLPVVVLSSSRGERDRQAALQRGATHYLVKPMRIDDYRRTVAYILCHFGTLAASGHGSLGGEGDDDCRGR